MAGKRKAPKKALFQAVTSTSLGSVSVLFRPGEKVIAAVEMKLLTRPKAEVSQTALTQLGKRVSKLFRASLEVLEQQGRILPEPVTSGLSDREEQLLSSGGFDPPPASFDAVDAVTKTATEFAWLIEDSYSIEQVRKLLGVNDSRVRQRLSTAQRTLYGFKVGASWRIPRFQFEHQRLIPGLEVVVASLPLDLDPVSVYRWFTTPTAELEADDEKPTSPLDWLRMGRSPAAVAELAATL
ncbi:MAG: helix-turn-helix domain-containing protein [Actinobacteria bacterium]|nr:helix-turn-helix domain-containing protein [Actinomycetota bacterium]